MKILKRYVDEDIWIESSLKECLERTEGAGYWAPDSVLPILQDGRMVYTPFAWYKMDAVETSGRTFGP